MNPTIKAQWLAALTSGEYKQTTGKLRDEYGFCCLGVLCDIKDKTNWENLNVDDEYPSYRFGWDDPSGEILPHEVIDWAEFKDSDDDPGFDFEAQHITLSHLNDSGLSFSQIADVINYFF